MFGKFVADTGFYDVALPDAGTILLYFFAIAGSLLSDGLIVSTLAWVFCQNLFV
jgi:hypothetical protein